MNRFELEHINTCIQWKSGGASALAIPMPGWLFTRCLKLELVQIHNWKKVKTMKIQLSLCLLLVTGLIAGCATEKESTLQAQAKISKADAQATALAKFPNATVKDCELEREHGRIIWSFALNTPDSKDITEVNVDATTGSVVNVEHEKAK